MGEMHADLVRPPGFEFEFDEGERLEPDGAVMVAVTLSDAADRDAWFAEIIVSDDLFFAVAFGAAGVGADWLVDDLGIGFDSALHECQVSFVGGAVLKLGGDLPVSHFVLGEDDAACGVAIEPVDDTGAGEFIADA